MGGKDGVTSGECLVPNVLESRPLHGIFHRDLFFNLGDWIAQPTAEEYRSAKEAAARLKAPISFRDSFLIHPLEKNTRYPVRQPPVAA